MRAQKIILAFFTILLVLNFFSTLNVYACKNIAAVDNATDGDYNLLLKVRDPSRPGLQTLTIIPKGYEYEYHKPWTGKTVEYKVENKFIGVVSHGDSSPNIVKPGMALSTSGLGFGDADSGVMWINPSRNGWDDFDWIRYACQTADSEEEAVTLLTEDVVKKMHATKVAENLFIVGPETGYIVEADAFHYDIKEVDDVVVMSNYPKELWKKSLLYRMYAPRFDTTFEDNVRKGQRVKLGLSCIFGIKIVDIDDNSISVRLIPFQLTRDNIAGAKIEKGENYKIRLGESEKIGHFMVKLIRIIGDKAEISMCYEYKEWEEIMLNKINLKHGQISVSDMINWSRLHSWDLNGLRSMCGINEAYSKEGAVIFKIPSENYKTLSEGWFSPNHPCSSIYVPFHISNTDIYEPYENSEAAELSLDLLYTYDHDYLSGHFYKTEEVFLYELDYLLRFIGSSSEKSEYITEIDMSMQRQAFWTQEMWKEADDVENKDEIIEIISEIWNTNYESSLPKMKNALCKLKTIDNSEYFIKKITDIILDICKTRINTLVNIDEPLQNLEKSYEKGEKLLNERQYEEGSTILIKVFSDSNKILNKQRIDPVKKMNVEEKRSSGFLSIMFMSGFFIFVTFVYYGGRKERKNYENH